MPTLNWIGKEAVVNHHQQVPFHLLKDVPELSCGDPGTGNLIVQGDNLVALKALLPYYAGQVKCIYIDPPYNTGNENWVYNDNVNSPLIREWLGCVVGSEGDTLDRHDRWLCMMYPRLALLKYFLRKDGILLVSIDENELDNLLKLCDEIFGKTNRLGTIIVRNNPRGRRFGTELAVEHEYLVTYCKEINSFKAGLMPLNGTQLDEYKHNDKDGKRFRLLGLRKRGALSLRTDRPNLHFPLYIDINNESVHLDNAPNRIEVIPRLSNGIDGVWRWSKKKIAVEGNLLIAKKVTRRDTGLVDWDIFEKNYAQNSEGETVGRLFPSIWQGSEFNNETAKDQLREIFQGEAPFDYPKSVGLVMNSILLSGSKDTLILDSFAGSGTMAHAVLQLNHQDGGNRRFILIEMESKVARGITSERVRRVASGYTNLKGEQVDGLGGSFRYCELAEPLFDKDGKIRDTVSFTDLARHVYFSETGEPLPDNTALKSPFLGICRDVGVYLLYNGILGDKRANGGNVLTRAVLAQLPPFDGQKVIYCAGCLLGRDRLLAERIVIRQIPYEIKIS
jgi:adenine-specific DNA-methyltransferase